MRRLVMVRMVVIVMFICPFFWIKIHQKEGLLRGGWVVWRS